MSPVSIQRDVSFINLDASWSAHHWYEIKSDKYQWHKNIRTNLNTFLKVRLKIINRLALIRPLTNPEPRRHYPKHCLPSRGTTSRPRWHVERWDWSWSEQEASAGCRSSALAAFWMSCMYIININTVTEKNFYVTESDLVRKSWSICINEYIKSTCLSSASLKCVICIFKCRLNLSHRGRPFNHL